MEKGHEYVRKITNSSNSSPLSQDFGKFACFFDGLPSKLKINFTQL